MSTRFTQEVIEVSLYNDEGKTRFTQEVIEVSLYNTGGNTRFTQCAIEVSQYYVRPPVRQPNVCVIC